VLDKANIDTAKNLIIATPSEAKNVFIVLSAKRKKRNLYIVSRAVYQDDADKLLMAGADQVLIPEIEGASHMALLVQKPHLKTFFELIANSDTDSEFLEIDAHQVRKVTPNLTIGDLQARASVNVISYNAQLNPSIHKVLKDNADKLVIWGNSEQIKIFKSLFL
jgi:voltage-gated potassium channel